MLNNEEIKESMTNDIRKMIRDYLNGNLKIKELTNLADLKYCQCGNVELEEDMVYHKWDVGHFGEQICSECRRNEVIKKGDIL